MIEDYYGLTIAPLETCDRWKWQIILPFGTAMTSYEEYATPEQAIEQGKRWLNIETAFTALNQVLSELWNQGSLSRQEYRHLLESFLHVTRNL